MHLAFILALIAALGREQALKRTMVVPFTIGFLFIYGLAADVLFRHRTFLPSRFEALAHYYLMALFVVSFTRHAIIKPLFCTPLVLVTVTAIGVSITVAIRSRKEQVCMPRGLAVAIVALFFSFASANAQESPALSVLISGGFRAAYHELVPEFERKSGYTIVTAYGGSTGNAPNSIPNRLERGEPADVVILASSALEELVKKHEVIPESRVDLARSMIAMAVRAGAQKPDISTVDALKHTLLAAKSIAYSDSISGVYLSTELFQRLGIAEAIRSKCIRVEIEMVGTVIARGDAEIGFQQLSELLPIAGIDIVGLLPAEAQKITVFSGGVPVHSKQPALARQFLRFLASPEAAAAIEKSGLQPITEHNTPRKSAALRLVTPKGKQMVLHVRQ